MTKKKEWADRNNPPYHYTITELVPQTTYCPELVQNTVLGTIVGIDGDEVLIDTAMVQTLKMEVPQMVQWGYFQN